MDSTQVLHAAPECRKAPRSDTQPSLSAPLVDRNTIQFVKMWFFFLFPYLRPAASPGAPVSDTESPGSKTQSNLHRHWTDQSQLYLTFHVSLKPRKPFRINVTADRLTFTLKSQSNSIFISTLLLLKSSSQMVSRSMQIFFFSSNTLTSSLKLILFTPGYRASTKEEES